MLKPLAEPERKARLDIADRVLKDIERVCDLENEECAQLALKTLVDLGLPVAASKVAIALRSRYRR